MPKQKTNNERALESLATLSNSKDGVEYFQALRSVRQNGQIWDGETAVPPASFLQKGIDLFKETTDFPLEVPKYLILHYLAAYLLSRNVTVKVAGMTMHPDFWTVILAPSGSGKTFTEQFLSKLFKSLNIPMMPNANSAAKFVELLQEHNHGLWIRDEFGQFIKQMESNTGPQAEMRDILLNLYGGGKIERHTKQSDIVIENAALSFVGLTVGETYLQQMSLESIVDGFGQRFSYVFADPDPSRPMKDFPLYTTHKKSTRGLQGELNKIVGCVTDGDVFTVGTKAEDEFNRAFRSLANGATIPDSFFRRAMIRAVQYALVYHVMFKKRSKTLDADDMAWAVRLTALRLRDAGRLLEGHGMSELEQWCLRAEAIRERCKQEGKDFTPREVSRGIHAIKTAAQARSVMELIGG